MYQINLTLPRIRLVSNIRVYIYIYIQKTFQKYRFVTEYEPSFPDIRKAFRKFDHILKNDEKMKKVFPMVRSIFKYLKKEGPKTSRKS